MKKKRFGFYVELTDKEEEIIQSLRKKHSINITQLIKKCLIEYYEKLEGFEKFREK